MCLIQVFYLVLLRSNVDGFSPLDIAAMLGRPSIIKMLLLYGAQEGTKCMCFAHFSILNLLFFVMFCLQYSIYSCNAVFRHYKSHFPLTNNDNNNNLIIIIIIIIITIIPFIIR